MHLRGWTQIQKTNAFHLLWLHGNDVPQELFISCVTSLKSSQFPQQNFPVLEFLQLPTGTFHLLPSPRLAFLKPLKFWDSKSLGWSHGILLLFEAPSGREVYHCCYLTQSSFLRLKPINFLSCHHRLNESILRSIFSFKKNLLPLAHPHLLGLSLYASMNSFSSFLWSALF